MEIVLKIPSLTLGNTNIQFTEKELISKTYITAKILPTIKKMKFINGKDFAKAILDKDVKVFIVYVSSLSL